MPRQKRKRTRNYPYCLCVIDMQPSFEASQDPDTMKACLDLVKKAMDDDAFIAIAQYIRYGKTDSRITKLVGGYRHVGVCWADQDNKADAIMNLLSRNNVQTIDYHLCGVNLDACVHATIYFLMKTYRKKLILHESACNTTNLLYYDDVITTMKQEGVKIMH